MMMMERILSLVSHCCELLHSAATVENVGTDDTFLSVIKADSRSELSIYRFKYCSICWLMRFRDDARSAILGNFEFASKCCLRRMSLKGG